jgi:hypothetical protein
MRNILAEFSNLDLFTGQIRTRLYFYACSNSFKSKIELCLNTSLSIALEYMIKLNL